MKTTYDTMPQEIQRLGTGACYVNMNITERHVDNKTVYDVDYVRINGKPTYPLVVEALIRERYDINQELAIQRQRETKPEDFSEYDDYCEWCKDSARPVFYKEEQ